jgi:hypothetical protein
LWEFPAVVLFAGWVWGVYSIRRSRGISLLLCAACGWAYAWLGEIVRGIGV